MLERSNSRSHEFHVSERRRSSSVVFSVFNNNNNNTTTDTSSRRFNNAVSDDVDDDDNQWKMGDPRNVNDTKWSDIRDKCGAFVNNRWIQYAMTALIIINAVLMGTMTFDFVKNDDTLTTQLEFFDLSILCAFTVEFTLQLVYLGKETRKNSWLIFDGLVASLSWVFMGSPVKILRSFRIFRIFALVSRLESLRILFLAVAQSVPKMASIWMILGMFFYVFAVLYTNLYSDLYDDGYLDWDYFGRLDNTLITLFQFMTLDSWTGVVRQVMASDPYAFIGFFIFVMTTSFVVLNLMIAVVCESLLNLNIDDGGNNVAGDKADLLDDTTTENCSQQAKTVTECSSEITAAQQEHDEDESRSLIASHKDIYESIAAVKDELKLTQQSLDEVKRDLAKSQEEIQMTLKVILSKISS